MPLPRPISLPKPPPLPSAADLAKRGFVFEPVGFAQSPVRLRLKGRALGVFPTREAAGQTIKNLST